MKKGHSSLVIIGFGAQAKAWSLNLRDSGLSISIALRSKSPHKELALKQNFEVLELETSELTNHQNFVILTPDHTHEEILKKNHPFLGQDSKIIYAHGFSFISGNFQKVYPQFEHILLAPKAIASEVRFQYETQGKLGAVFAVQNSQQIDQSEKFVRFLAKQLGITGLFESDFQEETYADLFSEQSLLCSLLPYGALASYNHLRKKGISQEVSFMECWLEVQLIANAMVKLGPEEFFKLISPNALLGGEKAKDKIFDQHFHQHLDHLINDIWDGTFMKECEDSNFQQLQSDVQSFWEKQEITHVYTKLKSQLINS